MDESVVLGIISVIVGLIVCLRGYVALRVIITVLGAWTGFVLGAALVAGMTDGGFLGVTFSWVAAVVGAIVLGLLAYAFYQVAVLLGLGAIGFTVAAGVLAALGVDSQAIIWLVAGAAGLLLAVLGLLLDLPAALLIVLTALSGATITLTGFFLLTGDVRLAHLETGVAPADLPAWSAIAALALAIVGIVVQRRGLARSGRMRETWKGTAAPR